MELRQELLKFKSEEDNYIKSSAEKFIRFLDFWQQYDNDKNYNPFFSYIKGYKDKKEEIELKVICANPKHKQRQG